MVRDFVALGACFSISPYFFHPRKAAQLEVFRSVVPPGRLLIETDAPDMWPPAELNPNPLVDAQSRPINDPRNIAWMYQQLAALRGVAESALRQEVAETFNSLFGQGLSANQTEVCPSL
jgi:TatD DNase family protein